MSRIAPRPSIALLLLAFAAVACAQPSPAPVTKAPKPPPPPPPELKPTWPVGAIAPETKPRPCVARLEIETRRDSGMLQLEATLTSNGDEPVDITLETECPGGPISFTGLGEGFDYYGTCNQGACAEPKGTVQLRVPARGETLPVASLRWPEVGDACRGKLAPGQYHVNAWAELKVPEGSVICGMAHASFEIPAPPRPAPTEPPKQCPPMPACGLVCETGRFARDENDCPLCACEESPWGTKAPRLPQ